MSNKTPQYIQIALSLLDDMDDATRKQYKSNLPRYAKTLHEQGTQITTALLQDHITQGLVQAHKPTKKKTYDSIVARFKVEQKPAQQADELPRNNRPVLFATQLFEESDSERAESKRNKQIINQFGTHAKNGDLDACIEMITKYEGVKLKGWGEDNLTYKALITPCFKHGHLDMLKAIIPHIKKGDYYRFKHEYGHALERGDMDMMRYVHEEIGIADDIEEYYSTSPGTMYTKTALKNGHWGAVQYAIPKATDQMKKGQNTELAKYLLEEMCRDNLYVEIDMILSWGISAKHFYNNDKELLLFSDHNQSLNHLLNNTDFYSKNDIEALLAIADPYQDKKMIRHIQSSKHATKAPPIGFKKWISTLGSFLIDKMREKDDVQRTDQYERAEILGLPRFLRGKAANQIESNIQKWQRMELEPSGFRMSTSNPDYIGKKTFEYAVDLFKGEGLMDDIAHEYAYNAAALFRTPDRILQYLEKWGHDTKQPLHDICYMIKMPQKGTIDTKSWGDAVLQHGPKMAKLVSFSDRIPQPLKSSDGKVYSYAKTKAETANFIYKKAKLAPEFAAACHEQSYKESDFNRGLKQIKAYQRKYASNDNKKPNERIPNITIAGSEFGMEGYTFRKLEDGSHKGLLLGAFTDCCQHLASAGASCAEHGFLSPNGGFYVVEDADGGIIGQSWAWRGNNDELVLDSLENLNGRIKGDQWQAIIDNMATHIAVSRPDITELNIGQGGKTPSLSFNGKASAAIPVDYKGYRDSSLQYCAYRSPKSPFASKPKAM